MANLIRTSQWHQIHSAMETQYREGLITLERHLGALVNDGVIAREEALKWVADSALQARLKA